jgi:Na+/H+ antiporter NhaD/arsenite permease-like protein
MISLQKKIIGNRDDRLFFAGLIVIAANAGGVWSPLGDVTTTMLWIGGQISALGIVTSLIVPSAVCLLLPLLVVSSKLSGEVDTPIDEGRSSTSSTPFERNTVFLLGIGSLLFVPIFKTVTHLPPFMGMLLGLGLLWVVTEMIHSEKDEVEKGILSVNHAIRKIDTPSILFFLGILLAIAALQSTGLLGRIALWLDASVGNLTIIGLLIGFFSAVVDNVPLVAATQAMYSLERFPSGHYFWEFLAYCTGTGGSALIVGSAAGVAAMGLEKIDFLWYLKRISGLAILGYLAGAAVYIAQSHLLQL